MIVPSREKLFLSPLVSVLRYNVSEKHRGLSKEVLEMFLTLTDTEKRKEGLSSTVGGCRQCTGVA